MSNEQLPAVLLTGFAPFGGEIHNPSWDAVSRLDGDVIAGHRIVARRLPVEFGASVDALRDMIDALSPALVLCVGQAGGRAQLSIERVAINVDDARIPDNAGAAPVDQPIARTVPPPTSRRCRSRRCWPNCAMPGFAAEISQTAGTYVCNHVFYGLMHALHARPAMRGGFIHIPYSPEQAAHHPGAPSLPVETVVAALRIALDTALTTRHDRRIAAGAEH